MKDLKSSVAHGDNDALPEPWGDRLVSASSLLLAAGLAIAWVQWAYFRLDFPALISYGAKDGWCLPSAEGIGIHCFGDFHQFIRHNASDAFPTTSTLDFSPGTSVLMSAFDRMASVTGARVALGTYLMLCALALLVPIAAGVRKWPMRRALPAVLLCGLATLPFLTVLDRGNAIAFCVPGLYLYVRGLKTQSVIDVSIGIALATVMKPQFIVLLVGLLALGRFRQSLWALASSVVALATAFSVFPPPWERIAAWLEAVQTAPDLLAPTSPRNLSLAAAAIHGFSFPSDTSRWSTIPRNLVILHPEAFGWLCAALVIALLAWRARIVGPPWVALAVLGIPAFCLSSSNMYYSVVALPLAAIVLAGGLRTEGRMRPVRHDLRRWVFITFVSVALAPIAFAWPLPAIQGPAPRSWWLTVVSTLWFVVTVLVLTLARQAPHDESAQPSTPSAQGPELQPKL